ncbi:MAG: gamma-glutamyltransferase [Acidobacteriota bacterium]|nr:gamma-glutamyltransferase [Acidobacteriota bacterium]
MRTRLALLLALFVSVPVALFAEGGPPSASAPFGETPTAHARRGAVASATPEATAVGAAVLGAGGNAVDAAVATAFALAVTYPPAGNLAGGGFAVGRTPGGELWALDFRETAPAGTWRDSFLGPDGKARRGASTRGGLAVGTPGTVRGLESLHRRYGSLPWARLIAPSVRLAREGFRVPPGLAKIFSTYAADLAKDAVASRLFLPGGEPLAAGALLVQEDLAKTLETIAAQGADGFHKGAVARRIANFVQATGGVLTEGDLASYRPEWRPPFVFDDGRFRLVTMPLPSSGGFLLASILGQLHFARGAIDDRDAPETLHLVAEAERRAYADRNRFLGDPNCVDVPLAALLAPARLAALGRSIDPARATPSSAIVGGAWPRDPDQTTHFVTATADGGAVSLTYTLNDTMGNRSVVPGVGVVLNNEMDDFAVEPGAPNGYGLVQGESNAVRAGARPLSSMTPTIVLEDGRPRLVLGSPGGGLIPTTVLQVYLNAAVRGEPIGEAVSARRFHHQHLPDRIELETGAFPEDVKDALKAKGHSLDLSGTVYTGGMLGRVHAIAFEKDGSLTAAADPRGYGAAAGK